MSDLSVTGNRFGAGTSIPGAITPKDPEVRDTRVKAPSVAQTSVPAATSYSHDNSRLSIERDEVTGHYVFKSIDPNTGMFCSNIRRKKCSPCLPRCGCRRPDRRQEP